jgi:spore maturation protein CgeB
MSAVDPAFHRRRELDPAARRRYGCAVGFVGTLVPSRLYRRRIAALEAVREFDLAIWSIHEVPSSLRPFHRGGALGEDMAKAISGAEIALNPHGDFMPYGGNLRLFEACGLGAFQITDDLPGVRRWFSPGTHLTTFEAVERLPTLVAEHLARPEERRRVAAAGQAHVHAQHSYEVRMRRLIELVDQVRRP